MIIDCHTHVNWFGHSDDDIVRHMDRIGVDKAWALSWEALDGGLDPMGYQHLPVESALCLPGRRGIGCRLPRQ